MSATVADGRWYLAQGRVSSDATSTLAGGITSGATTINFNTAWTSTSKYLVIDNEVMGPITAGNGTSSFTVTSRGLWGTSATSHTSGAVVSQANGGPVDTSAKPVFVDILAAGTLKYWSEVSESVTVTSTSRTAGGATQTETVTPTTSGAAAGSPVTAAELLSGVKSASSNGNISVEAATLIATGSASGGGKATSSSPAFITVGSTGAINVDNIVRLTSGTGAGQIRQIVGFNGTSVLVYPDWVTAPDSTTGYAIAVGMFFEKTPIEILTVQRHLLNAQGQGTGGLPVSISAKTFFMNNSTSSDFTSCSLIGTDASGDAVWAVCAAQNDSSFAAGRQGIPTAATLRSGTTGVTNGSNTFSDTSGAFSAADQNDTIFSPGNIVPGTKISSINSGVSVQLSANALTSASGQPWSIFNNQAQPAVGNTVAHGATPNTASAQGMWWAYVIPAGAVRQTFSNGFSFAASSS